MYAKEVKGEWFGVKIPEWLRAFDCRSLDEEGIPRTPWGTTLYSSERAAYDLGLRGQGRWDDTTLVSCQTYIDSRTAPEEELRSQITRMVRDAEKYRREYEEGQKYPSNGQGGTCLYMPLAICLSNYGWSIIADRRTQIVRRFGR